MARICLFGLISKHPGRNLGGAGVSLGRLAEHFVARGHEVDVLMRRPPAEARAFADLDGRVRLHYVDHPDRVRILLALRGLVRATRPDALLAFDTRANQIAGWLRLLPGPCPHLWLSLRNALNARHAGTLRRAARRADGVIAISHGLAGQFLTLTGCDPASVTVIHNPAVTPQLARLAAVPLGHPWFVPGGPPVVLAAGRLTAQKDYPTLLRAFATLRAARPCRLVILGQGELRETLLALAERLGVAADLDLVGFDPNPWQFMAHAAVFVLSSAWEGFGNVLAEALSLGTPVVSTDCPYGPREILQDGRLGPLVPVGDADALAAAIARTLDHPPQRADLIAGARAFAQDVAGDRYLGCLLAHRST